MKWYLAKMVYRIVCGEGNHTAQFDEQLRLITADDEEEAFEKACNMGKKEQESFLNQKNELVRWQFVNVPELYRLSKLIDGAEIYSRINEVEDAFAYTTFVNRKAESIREKQTHQLLNLI
jgi:hypothetical protein